MKPMKKPMKSTSWDRASRRQAKEWSVTDFLGRGKQGAEQVAFIQQLLNPQNKKFVEKIARMLGKRATGK
jgi:hypothetical protein